LEAGEGGGKNVGGIGEREMSNHHDSFLDTLPKGWAFDRLKDVVSLRNDKTDEASTDEDYLELEDLESGTGRILNRRNTLEVESAVTLFKKGDVLFGKLRPYLEKYYQADFGGKCTGEILAFKPERMESRFLFYCFGSRWFIERCNALAYGAKMPRVSWEKQLSQFNVPLPPPPEQHLIAAYLDASCAAIDTALSAKRRQLETLDALRNFTVHNAVTRGLNADAKMKPAGLNWLSEVPSHWSLSRIRNVAKLSPGYSGKPPVSDEECTVVPMELLYNDGSLDTTLRQPLEDISGGLTMFEAGDVLFAKITPCMENGKGAFVEKLPTRYAFGSTEFHVLRPTFAVDGRFLYFYTFNPIFRAYAAENMQGAAGQKRVQSRFLKDTRLFLPPLPEQRSISAFLVTKDNEFRTLFAELETQIATLTAYRKSLIHECVTGQRRITEADLNHVNAHG
jgi:type I restriction enzyme S subunit